MKHSQWLRLKADADRIVAALRADGFQCRKHTHRLFWHFRKGTVSYTLAWLPAPVGEWGLLPSDGTPERSQLLSQITPFRNDRELAAHPPPQTLDYPASPNS